MCGRYLILSSPEAFRRLFGYREQPSFPPRYNVIVNARAESVNDKPAFCYAMRRRRCLFPADGFYEWKDDAGRKRAFCVRPKDRAPVAFAGLWETWMGPHGEELETAAIVTAAANRDLATLHPRMPVIIPAEAFDFWLDCRSVDAMTATSLLDAAPNGLLEAYEISPAVNRTANDGPELIAPVAPAAMAEPRAAERRKPARSWDERQPSLFDDW